MPFILKKYFIKEPIKTFLFIIKELGYSQGEAQKFVAKGRVFKNTQAIKKGSDVIEGEIELVTFVPATKGLKPTFEEEEFVVFDKPSGVLIHPQNRHTPYSLVDEVKYQFGKDANICHRIDQETSGLVLCAKSKESERSLKMMFEERNIKKKYLALVHGEFKDELTIEAPLLRAESESKVIRMTVRVNENGKATKTIVKPLKYFNDLDMTLVEASPHTGRQHQIRVHLFHVKHSIVGDPIYGQSEDNIIRFLDRELSKEDRVKNCGASRLLLHANELSFSYKDKNYTIKSKDNFLKEIFIFNCFL
ncbi:MAG: RNA pseudouridine synthase [Helicobacteraceae bacterium]|nr:RNA pseudouridine synthase [Helicobacteraceae bacterium]